MRNSHSEDRCDRGHIPQDARNQILGEFKTLMAAVKTLTIEHDIIGVHLRAKRCNVIYLMGNRLKHPAQSIVAATDEATVGCPSREVHE